MPFPSRPVNHLAFKTIDTHQKAYALGFLLADGCVRDARPGQSSARVNLRIKAEDIQACRMLQKIAGGSLRLIEDGYRAHWEVCSNAIASDLAALGVTPRKTLTAALKWDAIPAHLHGAVLAGLIDGDGHLRFRKEDRRAEISLVTASAALRDQLLERFPFFKLGIAPPKPGRRELYTVKVENNRVLLAALINQVYESLPFSILDRKQRVLDLIRGYLADQDAYDDRMGHVAALKQEGLTIKEIASQLGTSRRPVLERLKAAGVNSQVVVFTEEDRQVMRRLHEGGMTVLQVYAALGKGTEQAVRYHLQEMGCLKKRALERQQPRHPDAEEIVSAFRAGKAANQIAAERGMCPRVVCRVLREDGVQLHRGVDQKMSAEKAAWAVQEMARGRTQRSVAAELGVSDTLVRLWIKRLEGASGPGNDGVQVHVSLGTSSDLMPACG